MGKGLRRIWTREGNLLLQTKGKGMKCSLHILKFFKLCSGLLFFHSGKWGAITHWVDPCLWYLWDNVNHWILTMWPIMSEGLWASTILLKDASWNILNVSGGLRKERGSNCPSCLPAEDWLFFDPFRDNVWAFGSSRYPPPSFSDLVEGNRLPYRGFYAADLPQPARVFHQPDWKSALSASWTNCAIIWSGCY